MKNIPNFANESINVIPEGEYLCLGKDCAGSSAGNIDAKMNEYQFILNRIVPNMFVFVRTGIYLYNPNSDRYHYNYNNRYLIIPFNIWEQYLPEIIKKEKSIYEKIGIPFPIEKENLIK